MTRRTQRVSELLRQEISLVLQRQLRDPRLRSLISITKVYTSEDLRHAKVYVSVLGDRSKSADVLHGLDSAAGYVRKELGDILTLKHIPSLAFVLDESLEKGKAVLEVMDRLSSDEAPSFQDPERESYESANDIQDGQS